MTDPGLTDHTKHGTAGGIITILLYNINADDILKTIVLATTGAFVSFFISLMLKCFIRKWGK